MSKSPKTRRTYTRRSPKTKIHNALDELRDLIDRHCDATQIAPMTKTAIQKQKASLAPYFDPSMNFRPTYPQENMASTYNNFGVVPQPMMQQPMMQQPMATSYTNYNGPMMAQPVMEQPKRLAKKVTCSGGPVKWNKFMAQKWQELKGQMSYAEARDIASKEYTEKCILDGTAIETGTGRNGKPGVPVDPSLAQAIIGTNTQPKTKRPYTRKAKPVTEKPTYANNLSNLFGVPVAPSVEQPKTKRPYTRKAKPNVPVAPSVAQPKTKRPYTRKVKVQAPGNAVPITPGRNNTKPNQFVRYQEPKATTTLNNLNLLGFNQPATTKTNNVKVNTTKTNTIGRINALASNNQTNNSSSANYETDSANYETGLANYETIGEPFKNGTQKIKMDDVEYFLTPEQELYLVSEDDPDDFGDFIGKYNPNIEGLINYNAI